MVDHLARVDTWLYAVFGRHSDRPRHDVDRDRYRGAAIGTDFGTYIARLYGLSWLVCGFGAAVAFAVGRSLSPAAFGAIAAAVSVPSVGPWHVTALLASLFGLLVKRSIILLGGVYVRWRANARRIAIERSLPGVVRYLQVLAVGSGDRHTMVRELAKQDAYAEISTSFGRVLETEALTGSLDDGLRNVAGTTPSRELLSPFLLKFREHTNRSPDSLRAYLRTESRMLSRQRSRTRRRISDRRTLLAELFVLCLAAPILLAVAVLVAGVLIPGLGGAAPLPTAPTVRDAVVVSSVAFVLVAGACTALLTAQLRPSGHVRTYERPTGWRTITTAVTNPASAGFVFAFPAVAVAWLLWLSEVSFPNVLLFGYVTYGFPVGAVAVKRGQLDDARDRELRDFVHAIAGHVNRGVPFVDAVESVANEMTLGVLGPDIDDLAFQLGLTTGTAGTDTRTEALDRFADRVGTPLAERTVGLVTGALHAGSGVETTFETLQTEVGSLYYGRKELRSAMLVYVVAAWAIALSVVGVAVFGSVYVLEGLVHLSEASALDRQPSSFDVDRAVQQLYLLAQATALSCGWFAGAASRGRYEALLHSSALVVVCYIAFVGAGLA